MWVQDFFFFFFYISFSTQIARICVCLCGTSVYLLGGRGRRIVFALSPNRFSSLVFFPVPFWLRIVLPAQLMMPNVFYEIWLVRFACPHCNNIWSWKKQNKKTGSKLFEHSRIWLLEGGYKWMNTCVRAVQFNTPEILLLTPLTFFKQYVLLKVLKRAREFSGDRNGCSGWHLRYLTWVRLHFCEISYKPEDNLFRNLTK